MYMAWLEHLWKTGDNWKESVLSFHHEGPKNQIHAVLLGGRGLYTHIHLTGLKFSFDKQTSLSNYVLMK